MSGIDWAILALTISAISGYGVWKTRAQQTGEGFLRGSRSLGWPAIGLSVMATQASAITFLSVPGQAYDDGLGFVQFYLGLPIAMVVIAAVFLPIYYRLEVYTAYDYLERRFDVRMRAVGAVLFLVSRGLAAGITIYAPAIILSSLLGLPLTGTNLLIGVVVILYTVSGGTEAVSQTQKQQMIVILIGMVIAGIILVLQLPDDMGISDAAALAGATGRMQVIDTHFDPESRYNIWSGLIGGFFLALAYFGTDQSQVQRYLTGRSLSASRLGLLFNGVFKIPMQLGILFVGILLFAFHVFEPAPAHFNPNVVESMEAEAPEVWADAQSQWYAANEVRAIAAEQLLAARHSGVDPTEAIATFSAAQVGLDAARSHTETVIADTLPDAELQDLDYVFITFVVQRMPVGLVGLLVAVIMLAAMSSTASELNALGTTTMVDLYERLGPGTIIDEQKRVRISKAFVVMWGTVALAFATFASMLDNLIEAVNILGSIFYGPILGIFLCAFFVKRVKSKHVLPAAVVGQAVIVALFAFGKLAFLWYNLIGWVVVVVVATALSYVMPDNPDSPDAPDTSR